MTGGNKVAATGLGGAIVAFITCCVIAVQSMLGCKGAPQIVTAPVPDVSEMQAAAPEAVVLPAYQPNAASQEITDAEYGKLTTWVEEYPELAGTVTRAFWEDFRINRQEYAVVWHEWQGLCQRTGYNKRRLLRVVINADPTPWSTENADAIKAEIRGIAPIPVPYPTLAKPPADDTAAPE